MLGLNGGLIGATRTTAAQQSVPGVWTLQEQAEARRNDLWPGRFSPLLITTELWLDAADSSTVITLGGGVNQWNDKSGNTRHASQGTAGNRPTYETAVQNGRNVVRFAAASSQFLTAGTTSTWNFLHNGTDSAVFMVARVRSAGDNPNAVHALLDTLAGASANVGYSAWYDDRSSVSANNALRFQVGRGVNLSLAVSAVEDEVITPGDYVITSNYIDANNATAASRSLTRINGGSELGSNTLANSPSTANSAAALNIGRSANAAQYFTGDFCEILLLNTQPDTTTRQQIEGYLAHKWGLTGSLPADHPYKIVAP